MRVPRSGTRGVLLVLALVLCACSSAYSGATLGQQVQSWANTSPDPHFAAAVATLRSDIDQVQQLAGNPAERRTLETVCDVLVTDSLRANQNLPAPDAQLTALLSSAYRNAAAAGQACFCASGGSPCPAGSSSSAALLARSSSKATQATRQLISAQARFDELVQGASSASPGAG